MSPSVTQPVLEYFQLELHTPYSTRDTFIAPEAENSTPFSARNRSPSAVCTRGSIVNRELYLYAARQSTQRYLAVSNVEVTSPEPTGDTGCLKDPSPGSQQGDWVVHTCNHPLLSQKAGQWSCACLQYPTPSSSNKIRPLLLYTVVEPCLVALHFHSRCLTHGNLLFCDGGNRLGTCWYMLEPLSALEISQSTVSPAVCRIFFLKILFSTGCRTARATIFI